MNLLSILVAYYSRTGTTREVAQRIRQRVGGELFEVCPVQAYPRDYRAITQVAHREHEQNARPAYLGGPVSLDDYDTVFVGYPAWWGTMPMVLATFLEQHDLAGKSIAPFCTHEGSGLGNSMADLRSLCPQGIVIGGLVLRGGGAEHVRTAAALRSLDAWLRSAGLLPDVG